MLNTAENIAGVEENNSFKDIILSTTLGEIRTFLDEVANGTSNYKSLHSLTEQIEHQYHGRFLIELIQNAHDALQDTKEKKQRIKICIVDDGEPFGSLYVANDGAPFSPSNFKSLTKLGQSNKDPQESIGNKGIGFRSVLELCNSPEIFSREASASSSFDGFCFRFSPEIKKVFRQSLEELLQGDREVSCPLDENISLVEWGESKFESFLRNCNAQPKDWLYEELDLLSPYLLPIPIDSQDAPTYVSYLEEEGFASVVRLPFLDEESRLKAEEKTEQLDIESIIFLDKLSSLTIEVDNYSKTITRSVDSIQGDQEQGKILTLRVETEDGNGEPKKYWLWERLLGGETDPEGREKIREAIKKSNLPGKWIELTKAKLSLAVKKSSVPGTGLLNIYLPTEIESGSGAHFSAPFYGDMSRTYIDFSKPYNVLLLKSLAEKASDVVFNSLADKGEDEASAIFDIISPDKSEEGRRWWSALESVWDEQEVKISEEKISLTDGGWDYFNRASILRVPGNPEVLDNELLRKSAQYPAYIENLSTMKDKVINVYNQVNITPFALDEQIADSLEKSAEILHSSAHLVDWDGFWHDVEDILDGKASILRGKKVLLGTDGQLHAVTDNSAVFFRPMKLGTDDEVESEEAIDDIPENLRQYIAFLHESITTHTSGEKGGHNLTRIHKFLSSVLVKGFGTEEILKNVLIPAVPDLPAPLETPEGALCQDILHWGLKLLLSLITREKGERLTKLLSPLPVPCNGGWYRMDESTFGPGWEDKVPDSVGSELLKFLDSVNTHDCKVHREKLLLPPESYHWKGLTDTAIPLLEDAGVSKGLQPRIIKTNSWASNFTISGYRSVEIPEKSPPVLWESCWQDYRNYVSTELAPKYSGNFEYEVGDMYTFPGLDLYDYFDDELRFAFMRLVFASFPSQKLNGDWEHLILSKVLGEKHTYTVKSPIKFFLEEESWLITTQDNSNTFFAPKARWLIPSSVFATRLHHYQHLKPVPVSLLELIERKHSIQELLISLGMPLFDLETHTSDNRLLRDLAEALTNPDIDIASKDVFLGMVRNAWSQFYPEDGDSLPDFLIVHGSAKSLEVVSPSEEEPVFLPDATEERHEGLELYGKPILAIEAKDAKRLQSHFIDYFGDAIQLASELEIKPIIDGALWDEQPAPILASTELEWLPPVVLAVFAYAGQQNRGTGTKTFSKAIDRLRDARFQLVSSLEIGLWNKYDQVAKISIDAFWHSPENLLFGVDDALTKVSVLSDALATAIDRADLPVYLKVVLGHLSNVNQPPDLNDIFAALKEVGISQDRYIDVLQRWLGSLSWTLKILRAIIHLIIPEISTTHLAEISTEQQLKAYVDQLDLKPLSSREVIELARCSKGLRDTGEQLYKHLGKSAQLEEWNNVLLKLDETPIRKTDLPEQFKQHIDSIRKPYRIIIREVLKNNLIDESFTSIEDKLYELKCPDDWSDKYWEVEFEMVMQEFKPLLTEVGAPDSILDVILTSSSVAELNQGLADLGVDTVSDPVTTHSNNIYKLKITIQKFIRISAAWSERTGIDYNFLLDGVERLIEQLEEFTTNAYVDHWDESDCLKIILNLREEGDDLELWELSESCGSLSELMVVLKINEEDIQHADENLRLQKEKKEKEKRMVDVCGQPFENSNDNLCNLWGHIEESAAEKSFPDLEMDRFQGLKHQGEKRKKKPGPKTKGKSRGKSSKRMTQDMNNLVGLSGEIYVYRWLKETFGEDIITPDCWVSENSKHKFPQNRADDSYGCDFEFSKGKKRYCIEVKASTGEDETFELGSSEIRLAIELANKRNTVFSVVHVTNVLSDDPDFHYLPNPYSKKFKSMYRIEDAGLKIRYESK